MTVQWLLSNTTGAFIKEENPVLTPNPILEQIGSGYEQALLNPSASSLEEGVSSTRFIIRVFKELIGGSQQWANTYELVADALTTVASVIPALAAIAAFERAIHYNFVQFDRATISTWTPDSKPYNPLTFLTVPFADVSGERVPTGDKQPLKMVLWAEKVAGVGRNGKCFYRGCLLESDVTSPAGDPDAENRETFFSFFSGKREQYLPPFLTGGASAVKLALIGPPTIVRTVNSIGPRGVTIVSDDHKWFNRSTGQVE